MLWFRIATLTVSPLKQLTASRQTFHPFLVGLCCSTKQKFNGIKWHHKVHGCTDVYIDFTDFFEKAQV